MSVFTTATPERIQDLLANMDTTLTAERTERNATYSARLAYHNVTRFTGQARRVHMFVEVTRTTSRSTKVYMVHLESDNYSGGDVIPAAVYNAQDNRVYSDTYNGYRHAALDLWALLEDSMVDAEPTPEPVPAVEAATPEPVPAVEPEAVMDSLSTSVGYLRRAAAARRDQLAAWERYMSATSARDAAGLPEVAAGAHRAHREAMSRYWAGVSQANLPDLEHIRRAAEAGDVAGVEDLEYSMSVAGLLASPGE